MDHDGGEGAGDGSGGGGREPNHGGTIPSSSVSSQQGPAQQQQQQQQPAPGSSAGPTATKQVSRKCGFDRAGKGSKPGVYRSTTRGGGRLRESIESFALASSFRRSSSTSKKKKSKTSKPRRYLSNSPRRRPPRCSRMDLCRRLRMEGAGQQQQQQQQEHRKHQISSNSTLVDPNLKPSSRTLGKSSRRLPSPPPTPGATTSTPT